MDETASIETSLADETMIVENESITNIAITEYLPKRSLIGFEKVVSQETMRFLPTLTLLDSNCDPTLSTYGITANDDSTRSVEIILESLIAN